MSIISAVKSIWEGFDFSYILSIIQSLIPALVCITLHELSHGYTAYLLGDDTAKSRGRLTLNPIKHMDVMGLLMMLVFHVGWAKPVPVNMYKFKNPKRGMALTALAGPMSNLVIAVVFMFVSGLLYIPLYSSSIGYFFLGMLQLTAYISIGLGLFNLIPIPPLDGSKVLFSLMSDEKYDKLMRYERYGGILMLILVASGFISRLLSAIISWTVYAISPAAQLGMTLVYNLFYK